MKALISLPFTLTLGLALAAVGGCSDSAAPPKNAASKGGSSGASSGGADQHEHAHPDSGPHGGHLIELGNEEYHAELVHDEDAGTVSIFLLDGTAKKPVAIEAAEVVVNLKHGGKGEQFKLAAQAQDRDPKGKSSRFVSNDKELGEDLDAEGADARLVVEINGKSYTGEVSHEH